MCAALTTAAIPGVHATVGDDHGELISLPYTGNHASLDASEVNPQHSIGLFTGKSPTVEIVLSDDWRGPSGKELLRLIRDEPLPGHPRVYVGGDIRTTDTTMTVVHAQH